ncbi:unnamed protein product, partial [Ectocarpus sp. 12 AP-2014]
IIVDSSDPVGPAETLFQPSFYQVRNVRETRQVITCRVSKTLENVAYVYREKISVHAKHENSEHPFYYCLYLALDACHIHDGPSRHVVAHDSYLNSKVQETS